MLAIIIKKDQMRKVAVLILVSLTIFSCKEINEKTSFKIYGSIDHNPEEYDKVILVTQSGEIQDTAIISSNTFEFKGVISEPMNAAIIFNKKMIQFPLVNDEIELTIVNAENAEFEINYKDSQVNNNLQTYFTKESKNYIEKYKLFEERKVNSKDDKVKYEIMLAEDSLSSDFISYLKNKYETIEDKSGLSIILNDLKGLIGTRNHPKEIEGLFKLLSVNEQNGFYGAKIKTYLKQSNKIALGQKINFDFTDLNQKSYRLDEFKGKLVLLEFWATWCGPCISQIPFLKKISEKNDKIQLISISIDQDLKKLENKIQELGMDWINIHYKQESIDLKKDFFITGVPYNILISQDGKILRKNIAMNDLLELLQK